MPARVVLQPEANEPVGSDGHALGGACGAHTIAGGVKQNHNTRLPAARAAAMRVPIVIRPLPTDVPR